MNMNTLEDLKLYLESKYKVEWKNLDTFEVIKKSEQVTNQYDLTYDESEYVTPIKSMNEDQSNSKTLINSKKAQEILIKRKK